MFLKHLKPLVDMYSSLLHWLFSWQQILLLWLKWLSSLSLFPRVVLPMWKLSFCFLGFEACFLGSPKNVSFASTACINTCITQNVLKLSGVSLRIGMLLSMECVNWLILYQKFQIQPSVCHSKTMKWWFVFLKEVCPWKFLVLFLNRLFFDCSKAFSNSNV